MNPDRSCKGSSPGEGTSSLGAIAKLLGGGGVRVGVLGLRGNLKKAKKEVRKWHPNQEEGLPAGAEKRGQGGGDISSNHVPESC